MIISRIGCATHHIVPLMRRCLKQCYHDTTRRVSTTASYASKVRGMSNYRVNDIQITHSTPASDTAVAYPFAITSEQAISHAAMVARFLTQGPDDPSLSSIATSSSLWLGIKQGLRPAEVAAIYLPVWIVYGVMEAMGVEINPATGSNVRSPTFCTFVQFC